MKKITINIPDNKYSFFLELIKNLGIEKVNKPSRNSSTIKGQKNKEKNVSSLRGKLELTNQQYDDFQQDVKKNRDEWSQNI